MRSTFFYLAVFLLGFTFLGCERSPGKNDQAAPPPAAASEIETLQAEVRINPRNLQAWIKLGNALGDAARYAEALAAFDQALKFDGESSAAHFGRGVTLGRLRRFEEAAQEHEFVLRKDEKNAGAWANLGVAYGELGRREQEIQCYQRALALEPSNVTAHFNLGVAAAEAGERQAAQRHFEAALRSDPTHADAHANLASIFIQSGDFQNAILHAQAALRVKNDHVQALNNLAAAYALTQESEKYKEAFRRLEQVAPDVAARLAAALEPAASSPNQLNELVQQATTLMNAMRYEEALPLLQKALDLSVRMNGRDDPGNVLLFLLLGSVETSLGKVAEAESHLREGLHLCAKGAPSINQHVSTLEELASLYMLVGRYFEAEERVRQALAICKNQQFPSDSPYRMRAYSMLSEIYLLQGRPADALPYIQQAYERARRVHSKPNAELAHCASTLGVIQMRLGHVKDAHGSFTVAREIRQRLGNAVAAAQIDVNLARLDFHMGQIQQAAARLSTAIPVLRTHFDERHPEMVGTYVLYATLLRLGGRAKEAEQELLRAKAALAQNRKKLAGDEWAVAHFEAAQNVRDLLGEWVAVEAALEKPPEAFAAVEEMRASALAKLMGRAPETSWDALRAVLREDEAFLSLQTSTASITAILVTKDNKVPIQCVVLADTLEQTIQYYAAWNKVAADCRKSTSGRDELERRLKNLFVDQEGKSVLTLPADVSRLIVAADHRISSIPLDHCFSPADVTYAPSASMFVQLRNRSQDLKKRPEPPKTLVLVGPPDYSDWDSLQNTLQKQNTPYSSVAGGLLALHGNQPPPITLANNEIIERLAAQSRWTAVPLKGKHASLTALEAAAPRATILHVLAHAKSGTPAAPLSAHIVLAPPASLTPDDFGFLTIDRLTTSWRNNERLKDWGCRLVFLAACETQASVDVGSNAISLPWGFFAAGCPTVIASLWPVDAEATGLLANRFYENLLGRYDKERNAGIKKYAPGACMAKSHALLEAKTWLSQQKPREQTPGAPADFSHPYFWASFVLIGEPEE